MNKSAVKNFAAKARRELTKAVIQRAYELEIEKDKKADKTLSSVHGKSLSEEEKVSRAALIDRIERLGFDPVMEEAAFEWFNRFAALRYMEVNGFLPQGMRVFSDEDGSFSPLILKEAHSLDHEELGLNGDYISELLDANEDETLYKYLLNAVIDNLTQTLPPLFPKIGDTSKLLFPSRILSPGSVPEMMVEEIPEDDWKGGVQIIGWLYQYYNAEPKAQAYADLKGSTKITKSTLPYVTQLFTPDWIVRYMVENSLGRLWLEAHPEQADELLPLWKYYVEEPAPTQPQSLAEGNNPRNTLSDNELSAPNSEGSSRALNEKRAEASVSVTDTTASDGTNALDTANDELANGNAVGDLLEAQKIVDEYAKVGSSVLSPDERARLEQAKRRLEELAEDNHNGNGNLSGGLSAAVAKKGLAVQMPSDTRLGELAKSNVSDMSTDELNYIKAAQKSLDVHFAGREMPEAYLDIRRRQGETEKCADDGLSAAVNLKEIKLIDPCMGSGHVLVYAFDVLMQIYKAQGYTPRDAVKGILENNLYGLDIDPRAFQLAYFSVMMKAREYDRRALSRGYKPHIYCVKPSNGIDKTACDYLTDGNVELEQAFNSIIDDMKDADLYGSLIEVEPVDFEALYNRIDRINADRDGEDSKTKTALIDYINIEILPMIKAAELLSMKYDCAVTNPPYLGGANMNAQLKRYVEKNFADYKADLFSSFIIRCSKLTEKSGYLGFLSPYVWMFIKNYEKLREYIFHNMTIETLIQFEYSAFGEATVPICTFVLKNSKENKKGGYFRLTEFRGGMEVQREKFLEALAEPNCGYYYEADEASFSQIPGSPVAYWVSDGLLKTFENGTPLGEVGECKKGSDTGNNDKYLRLWHEVDRNKIGVGYKSNEEFVSSLLKWVPYNKGGDFRRWYGNKYYVIDWENDGQALRNSSANLRSKHLFFKDAVTWSALTNGLAHFRFSDYGALFDSAGSSLFNDNELIFLIGFLNTKIPYTALQGINPTMNYGAGSVAQIPVLFPTPEVKRRVEELAQQNIDISKNDWDSFETSWDFAGSPLLPMGKGGALISDRYEELKKERRQMFVQLKQNEEELNKIFIELYGLEDEMSPEVEQKDVSVHITFDEKEDIPESLKNSSYVLTKKDEVKALLSYIVGCLFGRYSPDYEGLAYAGGEWHEERYKTVQPVKHNVLAISDSEFFEDDLAKKVFGFIRDVYGEENLEQNLKFIAEALGGTGNPRDEIREYFIKEFYKDHVKTYNKRPIYWLFTSGKRHAMDALSYIHRYRKDLAARIRTQYVHGMQSKVDTDIEALESRLNNADNKEKRRLSKKIAELSAQADELSEYESKIRRSADAMQELDLDDGIVQNYAKFKDVLGKL